MTVDRNGDSWLGPISGLFMIGMGILVPDQVSNPHVRAKHVEYWTAKASGIVLRLMSAIGSIFRL
jgi:hypothetical protein